jgi:hypothetical protein
MKSLDLETFGLIFLPACVAVLLLRWAVRGVLFRRREKKPLEDLFRSFGFRIPVDYDLFVQVVSLIGECYRISPGKLRANDSFSGNLGRIDSWDLDLGAERLEQNLKERYNIFLREPGCVKTVQDLIEYCQSAKDRLG